MGRHPCAQLNVVIVVVAAVTSSPYHRLPLSTCNRFLCNHVRLSTTILLRSGDIRDLIATVVKAEDDFIRDSSVLGHSWTIFGTKMRRYTASDGRV